MAKLSTTVKKTDTKATEFKCDGGTLVLDDNGQLVVRTEDCGDFNLIDVANELGLLGTEVKIVMAEKVETQEEISPFSLNTDELGE